MNTYTCDSHRPVQAESSSEAAEIFAGRKARALFGKRARVGALRCDGHAPDNSSHNWQAFVGLKTGLHETTGRNIWFQTFAT